MRHAKPHNERICKYIQHARINILPHLDQDRYRQAGEIEQRLDVHEICRRHQFEEQSLIDVHEIRVPFLHDLAYAVRFQGRRYGCHFFFFSPAFIRSYSWIELL